jgi:hypothetical protein
MMQNAAHEPLAMALTCGQVVDNFFSVFADVAAVHRLSVRPN